MTSLTPAGINAATRKLFPGSFSECAELGADFAVAHLVVGPDAIRPGGLISGPTQFSLADTVLWYLAFVALDRIEPMAVTSELSMRFLRPAIGAELWGRATLETAGRRSVVGSVRIWTDDNETRPCSIAQGTYALPWAPPP